jgi:hypothetical protein
MADENQSETVVREGDINECPDCGGNLQTIDEYYWETETPREYVIEVTCEGCEFMARKVFGVKKTIEI